MPLVSVIVPVYNVEKYLSRCLQSIMRQTYTHLEIILIDDGSTDSSGIICEKIAKTDKRMRVYHKRNGGLSEARNFGISVCSGDFVTFVDSDDVLSPDCVEVLESMLTATSSDISVSPCTGRFSKEEDIVCQPSGLGDITEYSQREYLDVFFRFKGNRSVHYACGKLYKRAVLEDDQYPVGMLNEDVEGTFKAILNSSHIVETNKIMYFYYMNPTSITNKEFGTNYLNLVMVWERVKEIAQKKRPDLIEDCEYNIKRADFTILCESILRGNQKTDEEYLGEISRLQERLRQNFVALLKGKMARQRKILLILITYCYEPARRIYRALQNLQGA